MLSLKRKDLIVWTDTYTYNICDFKEIEVHHNITFVFIVSEPTSRRPLYVWSVSGEINTSKKLSNRSNLWTGPEPTIQYQCLFCLVLFPMAYFPEKPATLNVKASLHSHLRMRTTSFMAEIISQTQAISAKGPWDVRLAVGITVVLRLGNLALLGWKLPFCTCDTSIVQLLHGKHVENLCWWYLFFYHVWVQRLSTLEVHTNVKLFRGMWFGQEGSNTSIAWAPLLRNTWDFLWSLLINLRQSCFAHICVSVNRSLPWVLTVAHTCLGLLHWTIIHAHQCRNMMKCLMTQSYTRFS